MVPVAKNRTGHPQLCVCSSAYTVPRMQFRVCSPTNSQPGREVLLSVPFHIHTSSSALHMAYRGIYSEMLSVMYKAFFAVRRATLCEYELKLSANEPAARWRWLQSGYAVRRLHTPNPSNSYFAGFNSSIPFTAYRPKRNCH